MSKLNRFITLIVVIFTVFAFVQSETKACPDGYTKDSVEVDIGTCHVKAYFCYICQDIYPGLEIVNIEYLIPNDCINNLDVIKSQLKDKVYHEIIVRMMEIPNCIKPCDDEEPPSVTYTVIKDIACKKLVNDIPNECFHLVECSYEYSRCVYKFGICVEIINGQPELSTEFIDSWMEQTDTCPNYTFPEIPLYPPNGWTSDCFFFDSCEFPN